MKYTKFALILSTLSTSAYAIEDCSPAVSLEGYQIEVSNDQGSDAENIQCALEAAAKSGIASVVLTSPTYTLNQPISVTGFSGSLSGRSKATTTVQIADGSVDCSEANSAAAAFFQGSVTVESMTINSAEICGSTGESAAILAFYGSDTDCDKRTTFANVDRVVLTGPGASSADLVTGIRMSAAEQCDKPVLGTLKVNRSELSGFATAVLSSLGGAGQTDINFNVISNSGIGVAFANANQSASINRNTFNFNSATDFAGVEDLGSVAVFVSGDADAPNDNLTSLKTNIFNNGDAAEKSYAVLVAQSDKKINHRIWVAGNTFNGVTSNPVDSSGGGSGSEDPINLSFDFSSPDQLGSWSAYINAFDSSCSSYLYGYPYSDLGSGVAEIVSDDSSSRLNVFSDYNNTNLPGQCLETNVYVERVITSGNVGQYVFEYEVAYPEESVRGTRTSGFIKVLDQSAGYIDIAGIMPVDSVEGGQSIEIEITTAMVGKLLQFGFSTTAVDYEPSGMFYDDVSFAPASSAGSDQTIAGSGIGIAGINTDGAIVSGNTFNKGATAWVAVDSVDQNSVSGWSLVDNDFAKSIAPTDISLGQGTIGFVIGGSQDKPRTNDFGDNDVLDQSSAVTNTSGVSAEINSDAEYFRSVVDDL